MGKETGIGYCDSSLNLQMGCDGCELWNSKVRTCYAGVLTERHAGKKGWPASFEDPTIFPKRLDQALKWSDLTNTNRPDKPHLDGYPRVIFLNDMGDTFTESLSVNWLEPFIKRMEQSPHIWLVLTKRPLRMKLFFDNLGYTPMNIWLGVTATDQATANARIPILMATNAYVHFVSIEPMLGPIDLIGPSKPHPTEEHLYLYDNLLLPDWIIVGGESGKGSNARTTEFAWMENIVNQGKRCGVPVFMKQLGSSWVNPMGLSDRKGTKIDEWPERLQVQELPTLLQAKTYAW